VAHSSSDSRALLVRGLRKLQRHGRLTGWEIRGAARALEVSEPTVWRWLRAEPPNSAGRPGPHPSNGA
jgi:hypothetical protein